MRRGLYIGGPIVPLTDLYPKGVMFVGRGRRRPDGIDPYEIDGTAFLVSLDNQAYAVTAAHVVSRKDVDYFVRVPLKGGGVKDLHVPKWWKNDQKLKDVAVAPILLPDNQDMVASDPPHFADDPSWADDKLFDGEGIDPQLGDIVYFIGLLQNVGAMVESNTPMVRAGTLGRLMQEDCPVVTPEKVVIYITAHLIDCRSFGGFSGSPVYLQQSRAGIVKRKDGSPGITTRYRTALFGMIGGHYDDYAAVENTYGKSDHLTVPVNTGVGYVIPVEFIRETLMKEELIAMRTEAKEREAAERGRKNAGTMDAVSLSDEPSEFERFEDLTRKLINTPKPKPDEKADQ